MERIGCVRLLALLMLITCCFMLAGGSRVEQGGDDGGGGGRDQVQEVTYDGRSLVIDGQRKVLFSGSIHYPRSTPQMWPSLIAKAKEGGLDVIQTYVFWNLHEPQPGQYDFSGRNDLVKFIKEIQSQGLYVCLRIGPYIESEWAYGGFPFWLHDVPGIVYRSDNEPFKLYMQSFTSKVVDLMRSERLYASQGGPIILSQIENEYQNVEASFHDKGPPYVRWAANMAVGLQTGVPWVMCKQTDAPDPVINTCNGMRCGETFTGPNSPNKPSLWTENWTSFYQVFGGEPYLRSAQDIAFHVALFIAKNNGSYVNYYMYHGGTNFGRTSSAYVITSYYDQAPIDEYGLLRQPKWGHLKELHAAIKASSKTLLQGSRSTIALGQLQEAYVFQEETEDEGCVAFLMNNDTNREATTVEFRNASFQLLPRSVTILAGCKTRVFDSANVTAEYNERTVTTKTTFDSPDQWQVFDDVVPNFGDTTTMLKADALLEHMNTTKDESDYLWYTSSLEYNSSCAKPSLHILSFAHVAYAFVDGKYIGSAHGNHDLKNFTLGVPVDLSDGTHDLSILSVMVGLPDSGAFLERRYAGLSRVEIRCSDAAGDAVVYDLSHSTWGYKVGLLGEELQIYGQGNEGNGTWSSGFTPSASQPPPPLTWYKSRRFDAPVGDDPVALNLSTMGKGEAWINGNSIGRYWVSFLTPKGSPSQTLYHVPRSFLKPTDNQLVVLEEEGGGGDPLRITVNTISATTSTAVDDGHFHHQVTRQFHEEK